MNGKSMSPTEGELSTDSGLEAAEGMTYNEIYTVLLADEDITMDIPRECVQPLRKALSNIKAKQNASLKQNGLPTDNRRIEFKVIEENIATRTSTVKVWFNEAEIVQVSNLRKNEGIGD